MRTRILRAILLLLLQACNNHNMSESSILINIACSHDFKNVFELSNQLHRCVMKLWIQWNCPNYMCSMFLSGMFVVSIGVVCALVMVIYFCSSKPGKHNLKQSGGLLPPSLTNFGSLEVWQLYGLTVWKSGSFTCWQSGSLAAEAVGVVNKWIEGVEVIGIDGI